MRLDRVINVTKHNGSFSAPSVRFRPDDDGHSVEIKVEEDVGDEDARLAVAIDGEKVHEVLTKWQSRGRVGLSVGTMGVDFVWDVIAVPMRFLFRTRDGGEECEECVQRLVWEGQWAWYSTLILGDVDD